MPTDKRLSTRQPPPHFPPPPHDHPNEEVHTTDTTENRNKAGKEGERKTAKRRRKTAEVEFIA